MPTHTTNEEYIKPLLTTILSILKIIKDPFAILKDISRNWDQSSVLQTISSTLKGWSIDARLTLVHFELIHDIPIPSVVVLFEGHFDRRGHIVILLRTNEEGATFFDPELGTFALTYQQVKRRWSTIVIALDAENILSHYAGEPNCIDEPSEQRQSDNVSVIMPVYNQAAFVGKALSSLECQTHQHWELILIDDNSGDELQTVIQPFVKNGKIRVLRNDRNKGLGYCLNKGLDNALHNLVAYLPADDVYFEKHLQSLVETLYATNARLVFSGVLYHSNEQVNGGYGLKTSGQIDGYPLQLVQVLHVRTEDRWMERDELVTDDLDKMFWNKFLLKNRRAIGTREVTCEWVDHPLQHHKIINDRKGGGIYYYKQYYDVKEPIKFQSSVGNYIDEISYFEHFRTKHSCNPEGLKIILVGELAYNPERFIAMEERGHKLYGIWINRPANYNAVGTLPFGNIEDIPLEDSCKRLREIQPDIIYALLNYQAVPLAYRVLMENPTIPFVWHFKEGPSYCMQNGTWPQLVDLYRSCDGRMYTNKTLKSWFEAFLPKTDALSFVMDGELPKREWFTNERSELLSATDNEIHTVFIGRPIGISPDDVQTLADQKIHLHFYGDIFHVAYKEFLREARALAPDYIHTHSNCTQDKWVSEFSKYDAGWLHIFRSQNNGEMTRANWFDLNNPARISTYAMAGVPMLHRDNTGHIVASQVITEQFQIGVGFKSFAELGSILKNKERMSQIRDNVWGNRFEFCFDNHVGDLISFFQKVIEQKLNRRQTHPGEKPVAM